MRLSGPQYILERNLLRQTRGKEQYQTHFTTMIIVVMGVNFLYIWFTIYISSQYSLTPLRYGECVSHRAFVKITRNNLFKRPRLVPADRRRSVGISYYSVRSSYLIVSFVYLSPYHDASEFLCPCYPKWYLSQRVLHFVILLLHRLLKFPPQLPNTNLLEIILFNKYLHTYLLYARNCFKHFTNINSYNPHKAL